MLAWLAFYFHGRAIEAGGQVKKLKIDNDQLATLIRTMQEQDARNRMLVAEQQQREQQIRQQASDNERKYRDAIQSDECAARDMPSTVIELLQSKESASTKIGSPSSP
ncbi:hypothetical protein D3C80_1909110 [compost metagenome]